MIVKTQKPIEIINKCGAYFHYGDLERAILSVATRPVCQKKTVFMHGRYPAVSVHGKKYHIHRLLANYYAGFKLPTSLVVHHIDGCPLNAIKRNLTIFKNGQHGSIHNAGKILTFAHRQKISEANKKRRGMKFKKKVKVFAKDIKPLLKKRWSINKIAKHFKCDWSTIKSRIHENPELLEELK